MCINRDKVLEQIGENIRYNRKLRNISINELSEMLNLSPAFIGLVERGKRGMKLENLIKLGEIFNITLDELIFSSYENSTEENIGEREILFISLNSVTKQLSEGELNFLISISKNLRLLNTGSLPSI